jgi:hypothetical protein
VFLAMAAEHSIGSADRMDTTRRRLSGVLADMRYLAEAGIPKYERRVASSPSPSLPPTGARGMYDRWLGRFRALLAAYAHARPDERDPSPIVAAIREAEWEVLAFKSGRVAAFARLGAPPRASADESIHLSLDAEPAAYCRGARFVDTDRARSLLQTKQREGGLSTAALARRAARTVDGWSAASIEQALSRFRHGARLNRDVWVAAVCAAVDAATEDGSR